MMGKPKYEKKLVRILATILLIPVFASSVLLSILVRPAYLVPQRSPSTGHLFSFLKIIIRVLTVMTN